MLKKIIKRDGTVEDFTPHKVNQWAEWAMKGLEGRVDWSRIVLEAVKSFEETANSQDLQMQLIKQCLSHRTWPYNLMAGKLYIAIFRKEIYGQQIPTVQELHRTMIGHGLIRAMNYTDEDFDYIEKVIDHSRDFNLAHFQIHQIRKKYSLQDRVTKEEFETPQFVYMRMAMALAEDEPRETRLLHLKNWYDHFSFNRLNAPTPNYVNLGTDHSGFASCNLYTTNDSARSLAIGDHIAYTMTYMSAGIGGFLNTRSLGDGVRSNSIIHQGKLPYFASLGRAVKANLQGGRGGACTTYFSCFDPEVMTFVMLQNPRTVRDRQNRDIHFAIMMNRFFAMKVAKNEDIFTFNVKTAPRLMDAFFSGDQEQFAKIYAEYEADPSFKKEYISARAILLAAGQQSFEVATLYYLFIDEVNRHTPFKDTIHSSNLCCEVTEPTAPYERMMDLYSADDVSYIEITASIFPTPIKISGMSPVTLTDGRVIPAIDLKEEDVFTSGGYIVEVQKIISKKLSPEVSLCSLAAIVEPNIKSDEEYASVAYYALKMIDKCIHQSDYELPHIGYTAKQRLNAGVGLTGIAFSLAKRGLKYDDVMGRQKLHQIAERHSYHLISQSLRLGQELGNAPWMFRTKWAEGWLPIDTYKKTVDELAVPDYKYDWEALRTEIIANKGIRNSALISHMPVESSSKASGGPNSIYPVRELFMKKSDAHNMIDWCATDDDIYGDQYQSAWDINSVDMVKAYAVIQKFTDQAISADLYKDRSETIDITTEEIIETFLAMVKYGMKSRYYQNSKTSSKPVSEGEVPPPLEDEPIAERGCAGGACDV